MRRRLAGTLAVLVAFVGVLVVAPIMPTASADPNVNLVVVASSGSTPFLNTQADSFLLTVTNVGTASSSGPVTVTITEGWTMFPNQGYQVNIAYTLSGVGWTCTGSTSCTRTDPVNAGMSLPPIMATFTPYLGYDQVAIGAEVNNASDGNTNDNSGGTAAPIMRSLAPVLLTSMTATTGLFTSDQPGSYTILVHNFGAQAATGPITVSYSVEQPFVEAGDQTYYSPPISANGSGWNCPLKSPCTYTGNLAASATLPPITLNFDLFCSCGSGMDPSGIAIGQANVSDVANDLTQNANVQTPVVADTSDFPTSVDVTPMVVPDHEYTAPGNTIGANIIVENSGTDAATSPTTVDLRTTYGWSIAPTASGTDWSCAVINAPNDIECVNNDPVASGGQLPPLHFTDTLPLGYDGASYQLNVQAFNTSNTDAANDNLTEQLPVALGPSQLMPVLSPTTPTFAVGQPAAWDITVENTGFGAYPDPVTLSLGNLGSSFTGNGWSCDATTCTHAGPIPAGSALPPIVAAETYSAAGLTPGVSATIETSVSFPIDTYTGGATAAVTETPPLTLLGLGDSVAAGFGLGSSEGFPDNPRAYPNIAASDDGYNGLDYAVKGACVALARQKVPFAGQPATPLSCANARTVSEQIQQAQTAGLTPSVITLTVGANDIDFASCIQAFLGLQSSNPCTGQTFNNDLAALKVNLNGLFGVLRQRYGNVPLVVTNYYNPFPPASATNVCPISALGAVTTHTLNFVADLFQPRAEQAAKLNALFVQTQGELYNDATNVITRLNNVINSAATVAHATIVPMSVAGHDMCGQYGNYTPWLFAPAGSISARVTSPFGSATYGPISFAVKDHCVSDPGTLDCIPSLGAATLQVGVGAFTASVTLGVTQNAVPHPNTVGQQQIATQVEAAIPHA